MTNSQVGALKKGDVVHDETPRGCIAYTVTSRPAPSRAQTYLEAWGVSRNGALVAAINYHGSWHPAQECPVAPVKAKKARR